MRGKGGDAVECDNKFDSPGRAIMYAFTDCVGNLSSGLQSDYQKPERANKQENERTKKTYSIPMFQPPDPK